MEDAFGLVTDSEKQRQWQIGELSHVFERTKWQFATSTIPFDFFKDEFGQFNFPITYISSIF